MQYLEYIQPSGNRQTYSNTTLLIDDMNYEFQFEYLYMEEQISGGDWSECLGCGYPNKFRFGSRPRIFVTYGGNPNDAPYGQVLDGAVTINKNGLWLNGTQIITISSPAGSVPSGYLTLGGDYQYPGDALVKSNTKLGRLKVYHSGTLVADYRPAIDNNVVGWYDEVGQVFMGSDGSAPWIAGPYLSSIVAIVDKTLFKASGGTATIDITTNNEWSASTTDNWITLSSSTGSGDTTITATIPAYTGTTDRTDTITFTDTTTGDYVDIEIKQKKYVNGQPVYLGSNEVTELYLGSSAVSEAYLGEVLVFSSRPFVGIKITSSITFAKTGGTNEITIRCSDNWIINKDSGATWLTLSSTGGTSGKTVITATTQDNQTGSGLSTTLTAMTIDSAYSATCEVEQSFCTPVICSAYTDYAISADSSNTIITDCEYDLSGVVEISDMDHGNRPRVIISNNRFGTRQYTTTVMLNTTSSATLWDYVFNEMSALTYIEVDMTSAQRVESFMYRCPNLQTLVINNCPATGVTKFSGGINNDDCPNLTNIYINGSLPGSCDMKLINENSYQNRCQNVSVDSLNRILAALPTIGTSGQNVHTCFLGSTNKNKLSAAEIAVGTNKGWNIQ